jgi:hypothetical protein
MTDDEAIAECERWLRHLENQKEKSARLQELARMAKEGPEQHKEAMRLLRQISRNPTVYDAGKLQPAVRHLIKRFEDWKTG